MRKRPGLFLLTVVCVLTFVNSQKLRRGLRPTNRSTTTSTTTAPSSSNVPIIDEDQSVKGDDLLENFEVFDDIENVENITRKYETTNRTNLKHSVKANPILIDSKDIRKQTELKGKVLNDIIRSNTTESLRNTSGSSRNASISSKIAPISSKNAPNIGDDNIDTYYDTDEVRPQEIKKSTQTRKNIENPAEDDIFENSEVLRIGNKSYISGALVTKVLPEILKFNGRMEIGSSEDSIIEAPTTINSKELDSESGGAIMTLVASRRIREEPMETVEDSDEEDRKSDYKNISRLEDVFDLYNPYRLDQIWEKTENIRKLSPECKYQMEVFLRSLRRGSVWALKMWDASGHYSGSFFWGNQYWMGSRTLCTEISRAETDLPFKVGFSVVRTNLTLLFTDRKRWRSQYVGICLPYVCSKFDIKLLVQESITSGSGEKDRYTEVQRIKTPHDYYHMIHDKTFWLVVLSSIIVAGFITVGTVLDIVTERRKKGRPFLSRFQIKYNYDNYTYAVNPPLQMTDDKLEGSTNHTTTRTSCSTPATSTSELEDMKPGIWHEVFLSFSLTRNVKQICDSTIGADTIPIIHGLRSISMAWVILGHTCIVAFKYSDNMEYRKVAERELLYQTINNTAFTVDTFFFISGLLVSFLYFRTTAKFNVNKLTKTTGFLSHCIEFVGLIGYRFCRLTIPYIFTLGLVELSMKWFYYNSIFDPPADDHINCPNYWWRNLLYVNTLFPVKDMCMLWSWYLADDTQFYIFGIILLITAIRHFKFVSVSVVMLLVASWCTTGYIAYLNNHMPNADDPLALFDKIYDKPWTRSGPYLIGMTVGWILFKTDCKIPMKRVTAAVGWILCTACMLSLVYGLHKQQLDTITAAAYSSLSHTAWAIGLSWIVIACSTGHGGYANKLLSCKLLIPFSRTTYCAYLIHPIIIRLVVMTRDSPVHLSEETIAIMFLGQLTGSYLLAFALSVTFEAPVVSLLKIVSPTKRNKA